MEITTWLTYVTVISALIIIPGPSSLLITMHGINHGFGKASHTIWGNLLGSLLLMSISAFGVSALLLSSEMVFSIVKYLGAAYLIYLGIKMVNDSSSNPAAIIDDNLGSEAGNKSQFRSGLLTGISNPKDIIFFASLFPTFLSHEQSIAIQLVILMATWLVVDFFIKVLYLLAGKKISNMFSGDVFRTWFNRIAGSTFMGFGVVIALYNRN